MFVYKGLLLQFDDEKNSEIFASIINFNQSASFWEKIYYPNGTSIDSTIKNALQYHKDF